MVKQSNILVGVGWMILSGLNFVAVTAIVKHIGSDVPPAQAAFLRYVIGAVFLIPMIRPIFSSGMSKHELWTFGWRGLVHSIGVILWFYAMTRITIAEVTAMNYLAPVYITLGAAMFLGEPLAFRRLAAVGAAMIGALIILRPGVRELSPGHLAMLFAAFAFAASYLLAKRLSDTYNPAIIVGMLSFTVPVALAPFAATVWVRPGIGDIGWLVLVALFATAAHYAMTMAFRYAPVSSVQPATFLQLVWAGLLGTLVFGEKTDIWVMFGGTVILASVCFIAWREKVLAGERRRTASNGTK